MNDLRGRESLDRADGPSLSPSAELLVEQFEAAWRAAADANFEFEPDVVLWSLSAEPNEQQKLLRELIAVDLETRWRHQRGQKRLDAYVKRIPTLSWEALPLELVLEEYRARCRWSELPSRSEFLARFPWLSQLSDAMAEVEAELCLEGAMPASEHDMFAPLNSSDFLLRRQLGVGGTARVYTAVQRSLDKVVAVKVLKKRWKDDSDVVGRFLTEARVAAQLRHPQIVDVHGLGRFRGGELFMVMDLIQGKSIRDHITNGRRWSLDEALNIISIAATVLDAIHQQGYLHGDVTPANLLLNAHDTPFITDFGMSVPRHRANEPHQVRGVTPGYSAPEQEQNLPLGPETDVYGLGATLAAMVTGDLRWRLDGVADHALRTLIQRCVAPRREDRFATAASMRTATLSLRKG